jgi:hypothetical protein
MQDLMGCQTAHPTNKYWSLCTAPVHCQHCFVWWLQVDYAHHGVAGVCSCRVSGAGMREHTVRFTARTVAVRMRVHKSLV